MEIKEYNDSCNINFFWRKGDYKIIIDLKIKCSLMQRDCLTIILQSMIICKISENISIRIIFLNEWNFNNGLFDISQIVQLASEVRDFSSSQAWNFIKKLEFLRKTSKRTVIAPKYISVSSPRMLGPLFFSPSSSFFFFSFTFFVLIHYYCLLVIATRCNIKPLLI